MEFSHQFFSQGRLWQPRSCRYMALAACVVGLSGCALWQREAGSSDPTARTDEPVAVDTQIAKTGTLAAALTYTGTTQPDQLVSLRSRVDGQVTLLTVDVGDAVAADDAVARLDADLLTVEVNQAQAELQARQSEVAQAQAAVSDAQTALEVARAQLIQAQTEANRLSRLATDGAIALQDAEQAQLTVDTGQQVLRSAEEQIRTRQAAVSAAQGRANAQRAVVAQAQERLSYALVRSPLTGVVIERLVETGDYAESGDELMQIGDLSRIKVVIEVSDRDLSQVVVGQPVEVTVDAFPNQLWVGRITRVAPAADATSRLVPVEVTIPNESGQIGSGLLARVTLVGEERDRLAIPKTALDIAAVETSTVFVVTDINGDAGTAQARTLELGRETNARVEVLSGLQAGETLIVRSDSELQEGQAVRLSILSETNP